MNDTEKNVKVGIEKTLVRVLEDWAMALVDEPTGEVAFDKMFDPEQPLIVGKVQFAGPVKGTYTVVCSQEFIQELVGNLIGGGDSEPTESDVTDGMCEFVNVLAGNLLTETYGEEIAFALNRPEAQDAAFDEVAPLFQRWSAIAVADGMPVGVTFDLES
jgi:hypothetical protein